MEKTYQTRAEYDADHQVCPTCGGEPSFVTYVGWVFRPGKPYQDRNNCECKCGWKGTVRDLVPARKGTARQGGIFAMDRMPTKKQRAAERKRAKSELRECRPGGSGASRT